MEFPRLRRNLWNSILDGSCYSCMVGLGESYLSAFMLALGFSPLSSALITTVPLLAGALLQLFTPRGVRKFGSYSRWVVAAALVQGLSYFLFVGAAASTRRPPEWTLYLAASIYWGASMATGPAWNAWVGALIPKQLHTTFFSFRSRVCYVATLVGLVAGGVLLQKNKAPANILLAFALLFAGSGILRFFSAFFLARQSEPSGLAGNIHLLSLRATLKKIAHQSYGKILGYLFFLQIAVQISSGFFSPFMLSHLRMNYSSYMALMATALVAKALAMPFTERLIRSHGLRKILVVATIGIAPLPVAWLLSKSLLFLFTLQILSGFFWATHELATFLILFSEIPEADRPCVLSSFNLIQTAGLATGALIGGAVFYHLHQNYYAYQTIFLISTTLRLAALFAIPHFAQPFVEAGFRIFYRTHRVRPRLGMVSPNANWPIANTTNPAPAQTLAAPQSRHPTPQ